MWEQKFEKNIKIRPVSKSTTKLLNLKYEKISAANLNSMLEFYIFYGDYGMSTKIGRNLSEISKTNFIEKKNVENTIGVRSFKNGIKCPKI